MKTKSLFLLFVFALCLVSCGSSNDDEESSSMNIKADNIETNIEVA